MGLIKMCGYELMFNCDLQENINLKYKKYNKKLEKDETL